MKKNGTLARAHHISRAVTGLRSNEEQRAEKAEIDRLARALKKEEKRQANRDRFALQSARYQERKREERDGR